MQSEIFRRLKSVPAIVHIIVTQATRRRAEGGISEAVYHEQIRRITREELEPKGLTLLMRELPGGRARCIIKEQASGRVCDLLEFAADGTLETEDSERGTDFSECEAAPSAGHLRQQSQ